MTYSEIVETLKREGQLRASDITGEQVLMLFHDRLIKNFTHDGDVYEINFVPIENEHEYTQIDTIQYSDYFSILRLMECWIHDFIDNKPIYIIFDDEKYEICIELLETKT